MHIARIRRPKTHEFCFSIASSTIDVVSCSYSSSFDQYMHSEHAETDQRSFHGKVKGPCNDMQHMARINNISRLDDTRIMPRLTSRDGCNDVIALVSSTHTESYAGQSVSHSWSAIGQHLSFLVVLSTPSFWMYKYSRALSCLHRFVSSRLVRHLS